MAVFVHLHEQSTLAAFSCARQVATVQLHYSAIQILMKYFDNFFVKQIIMLRARTVELTFRMHGGCLLGWLTPLRASPPLLYLGFR